MKKWFLLSALTVLIFSACKKNKDCSSLPPTTVASAAETAYLQEYLTTKGITATEKNGMFYSISTQGSGTSPNQCSTIGLTYSGNIITNTGDGGVFDATPAGQKSTFSLSGLIAGWKIIFPLVKAGGNVTLYIPPSLAYGAQASPARPGFVGIPANSYLKFTVSLIDVQ
jgi:FKBP-type peptidyl-prolyl cis-trans isomerase FkpA